MGLADRDYMRTNNVTERGNRPPPLLQRLQFMWWRFRRWIRRTGGRMFKS